MAETKLVLKVDAGKDEFYVFDKTGAYSSQNTEGWGLPNTAISDVISAEVKVLLPKSDTYLSVNVFPALPNSSGIGYEIIPSDLGLELFPPGVYTFEYVANLSDGSSLTTKFLFYNYLPLECCISKKKEALCLTDVSSEKALKVVELEMLLENSIWAACSGDNSSAEEISDLIWTACNCCC